MYLFYERTDVGTGELQILEKIALRTTSGTFLIFSRSWE